MPLPRPSLPGGIALLCAAALLILALGPVAPIATVDVRGARHVPAGAVAAASGLEGAAAFRASAGDARTRLRALPAVREAVVELSLPDRARITVIEREAAGRWVGAGVEWFVDDAGWLFASADPSAAPALRVQDERVTPGRSLAGERLDPNLVAGALRLARLAPGELRADMVRPEVVMTAGPSGLVLRSGAGWEIRFGSPEAFTEKLQRARQFLRENPERRLDYLDVRSADHIVFSPS